ncbi:MAG: alpha/beta hydrolase [Clostridia bacterium]|nr:alpha/beta hydrolase [Clostridia bacterium]
MEIRPFLDSLPPDQVPDNPDLPDGVQCVRWQDTFGFGVAFKPNIVYAEKSGMPLHLHYLTPRNNRADNPLIVFVQGSAWFKQDLYLHLPEMVRMCQKGYCVAMVEYRPSQVSPFPAQAEDVKSAIRFLRSRPEYFHFHPDRVAVWGDSSGGHTALMVGFTGDACPSCESNPPHSAAVRCIVDWYGPTVISEMAFEPSACPHTDADSPEGWLIGHVPVQDHPDLAAATVPQSYLKKDVPTPPLLIMHGSMDKTVNFQQSVHLYEAMRQLEKEVTFIKLLGADHSFGGFCCDEALNTVDAFLKKHL